MKAFGGQKSGLLYLIIQELVGGMDLEEYLLENRGSLTLEDSRVILMDIATGLCATHSAGVIHRYLKPSNVLVGREGRAKLTDFGCACVDDGSRHETCGTPLYSAPEVLTGKLYSRPVDLWSYAVLLFKV